MRLLGNLEVHDIQHAIADTENQATTCFDLPYRWPRKQALKECIRLRTSFGDAGVYRNYIF